jgi:hypothetical protein
VGRAGGRGDLATGFDSPPPLPLLYPHPSSLLPPNSVRAAGVSGQLTPEGASTLHLRRFVFCSCNCRSSILRYAATNPPLVLSGISPALERARESIHTAGPAAAADAVAGSPPPPPPPRCRHWGIWAATGEVTGRTAAADGLPAHGFSCC